MNIMNQSGNVLAHYSGDIIDGVKQLHIAQLNGLDLTGANFYKLSAEAVIFGPLKLHNASFMDSEIYWPIFAGTDLEGANFENSRLYGANFIGANLRHAYCRSAQWLPDRIGHPCQLQGADFRISNWKEAQFTNAEYDDNTIFPDGFSPIDFGMKLVAR